MKKVALFIVLLAGVVALAAKSELMGAGADPVPQCPDQSGCLK